MENSYLNTRFETDEFEKLKGAFVRYECAQQLVQTQLENLNRFYNAYLSVNPIEHIKTRMKSPESIAGKLKKNGLPITAEAAQTELSDIVGFRIICSYAKNIYEIADVIKAQPDYKVVGEKDYVTHPKPSGYRSYHMIVEVKLGTLFGEQSCRVEIQIRTSAQDFWASLEHKARYKYNGEIPQHLGDELQNCADQINVLDERMYLIHELVDLINGDANSDTEKPDRPGDTIKSA